MALLIDTFDAAGTATTAGVFIPVEDLPGIASAELASSESVANREGKVMLALLNGILTAIETTSPLGLSMAQGNNSNGGANIIGLNYAMSWDKLIDLANDTVSVVPLPTTGANSGVGGMAILDAFPNAQKVSAAGAVSGAGVIVQDAGVATYGVAAPTVNAGDDNRKWFSALFDHMTDADVRVTGTTASAVTSATLGSVGSSAIPATYYAATDPVSGIAETDLPKLGLVTRASSLQIQVQLNQATQHFDVVVA